MINHKLSVIIPCYNEEKYIGRVVEKVLKASLPDNMEKEIIIIDDGSTDKSPVIIEAFSNERSDGAIKVILNVENKGKGACVVMGLQQATGDLIVIQDADLEYDPAEYIKLLKPVLDGYADVVYTSRLRGDAPRRVMFFYYTLGVWFLTFLSNLFTQLNLTDIHSGYKLFKADILKSMRLREKRFGFDTEVTAKISRIKNIHIYEVGISYYGRSYSEGKKIKWTDGLKAIYWTFKYNLFLRKR